MKKLLLFIIITLPLIASAQITVTVDDLPDTGRIYHFADDYSGANMKVNPAASGFIFWDFSRSFIISDTTDWDFITPSATPFPNDYPNADLAISNDEDSIYMYFKRDSVGLLLDGLRLNNEEYRGKADFNPDDLHYPVNFTYGDSVYDFSRLQVTVPQDQVTLRIIRRQEKWIKADAFGALVTPEGFFQNVLRLETTLKATDSVAAQFGSIFFPIADSITYSRKYDWVQKGRNAMLVNITTDSAGINPMGGQYTFGFVPVDSNLYVTAVNDSVFCAGDSIIITYHSSIVVNSDNIFLGQLSGADGSFDKAYMLGLKADTTSGILRGVIPADVPSQSSSDYRLRILAGSPSVNGIPSSFTISVGGSPAVSTRPVFGLCEGDSIGLAAFGADNYTWYPSAGLSDTTLQNPIAKPAATTTYYVIGSTICGSDTDSVVVEVSQKPQIDAGRSKTMCEGESVVLEGSINDTSHAFMWTPSNGLDDARKLQPVAGPAQPMMYYLHANNGSCYVSDSVFVLVRPLPATSAISGPASVMKGNTETYSVTGWAGSGYTWNISGGTKVSGGSGSSISVEWTTLGTGRIEVVENALTGCSGPMKVMDVSVTPNTSVAETGNAQKMLLAPNPAKNLTKVLYEHKGYFVWQVELLDVLGKKIYSAKGEATNAMEEEIDLSSYSKGLYIIQLKINDRTISKRLVKE